MIRRGIGVQPYTAGSTPFVGLLDTYTGANVAYSVRKLRAAYTGSAIRVRRSSDNTEQDIGFDAVGNLNETALTTFVGANNGFVTTWYDQSGNGRNSVQTTAANQPRIVNSGVVEKIGSKPAVFYNGNQQLNTPAFTVSLTAFSIFVPLKALNTTNENQVIVSRFATDTNNRNFLFRANNSFSTRLDVTVNSSVASTNEYWTNAGVFNTTAALYTYSYNGALTASTIQSLRKNNAIAALSLRSGNNLVTKMMNNLEPLRIGNIGAISQYFFGHIPELIYYDQVLTTISAIETNINTYYSIY
jgi:hypothetical protein